MPPRGRGRGGPMIGGRSNIDLKHLGQSLRTTTTEAVKHVTLLEALPQLIKLLKLVWTLAPMRTAIMVLGNFTKSLLPALELRIRAQLIEHIDKVISGQSRFHGRSILSLLLLQLSSLTVKNLLEVAINNNQSLVNTRLSTVLRRDLLDAHLKLDVAALEDPTTQSILKDAVAMTTSGYLGELVRVVFNFTNSTTEIVARIAATSRIISMDTLPYFLLYSIVPLLRMTLMSSGIVQSAAVPNSDAVLRKADISSIAFSTKSRREVSLFNLQGYLASEFSKAEALLTDTDIQTTRRSQVAFRVLDTASSFSNSAIYALLAWRSTKSQISLAELHLIENTTSNLVWTADSALSMQQRSSAMLSGLLTYYQALKMRPMLVVPTDPVSYRSSDIGGMTIEFENVSFRYSENQPLVLEDVSFVLSPGTVTALVGYNGSGKSTLISLLARERDPTRGRILINGHDLRKYDRQSLADRMAFTHQDFARWPLTGYENVAVGNITSASVTDVKNAARATGAFQVLDTPQKTKSSADSSGEDSQDTLWDMRLSKMTTEMQAAQADNLYGPDDTNMNIRQRRRKKAVATAVELSGGQWQKVALARAFLRDGDALILDEPSANLDPQAEHDLFSNLLKDRGNRTTLFITHRLGIVRSADNIIFLDKGRIVERGSHSSLMQLDSGLYRHLVNLQDIVF